MRRRTAVTIAAVLLAACSACGSQPEPSYTVAHAITKGSAGSVDLIVPDANEDQARAAIRDYAAGLDGPELYYLKVVTSGGAPKYVCRGRWYVDELAYAEHGDGSEQPTKWPHLAVHCP
jgi:hypothetical protein